MELNREQIIKALECCAYGDCKDCTECSNDSCGTKVLGGALELIKTQEQRIKELTEKSNNFEQAYDCMHSACLELSSKCDRLTEENERLHASCTELTQSCTKLTEENERLRKNLETFKGKQKSLQKQIEVLSKENHLLLSKDFDITVGDCHIVFSNGKKGNIYTFTEKDQIAKEMLEGGNEASGGE